jgi:hypothetical protein
MPLSVRVSSLSLLTVRAYAGRQRQGHPTV